MLSEIAIRIYAHFNLIYDIEMARYAKELKRTSINPKIAHEHKLNGVAHLMGTNIRINSDGLRDRNYPVERTNKYRIIFLGDSLTFGWGVNQDDTFENIIETEINKQQPIEIINFGVGNYNSEQQTHQFIEKGLKYHPDSVVVFWFINDAEPTPNKSEWGIIQYSEFSSYLWSRIRRLGPKLSITKSYTNYYQSLYEQNAIGWLNAKKALLLLKLVCKNNNIDLKVVLLPELHQLSNFPFKAEYKAMSDYLQSIEIPYLDITPNFINEFDPKRLWVASDDAHPNAIGHRLIAQYSKEFILPTK